MTTFALLAYDGIEPIDIGATYGVLSMAKRIVPGLSFFVVAQTAGEVVMANGLRLIADHAVADAPAADILMVLGGPGWPQATETAAILDHIRAFYDAGGTVAAVCTGGMIVGAAGLLDGRRATTKREIVAGETRPLDLLAERHPAAEVVEARLVDEGRVLTGGGVSLGMDMTLHLIGRAFGDAAAMETARILEYATAWEANGRTFKAL
ncbi:MAG: DJ-1/PfpI family protein [Alphaproteobacteria bacterium]|nr:DJ-1/PfpI family protein [Alphaproteobacteria bacterium]